MEEQIKVLVQVGAIGGFAWMMLRYVLATNKAQGERLAKNDERNVEVISANTEALTGNTKVLEKILDNEERLGAEVVELRRTMHRRPCLKEG